MANSIEDIKALANTKLGFARPNKFLVTLPTVGVGGGLLAGIIGAFNGGNGGASPRELNILCSQASLPAKSILTNERRIGMEYQKMAYGYQIDGFNIIVNGSSDQEAAEKVASEVRAKGSTAMVAMGDVGDKAAAEQIVQAGLDQFGAIDVLVNNAAIRPHAPFLDINEAEWQRVMNVDLNAAIWLSRLVLPVLLTKDGGALSVFRA